MSRGFMPLVALAFLGAGRTEAQSDMVFGPYVNRVSDSGARVLWVARRGVRADCALRDDGEPKAETVITAIAGRSEQLHTAVVTGLKEGRTYRYVVTCGRDRAEGSFRTAPGARSREPLKFAVYGDSRSEVRRHRAVVDAVMKELPLAFVLHTGDFVDDGREWPQWKREFFDPARSLLRKTVLWPVRGNHEEDAVTYRDLVDLPASELYYSFDVGNVHVAVLDSNRAPSARRRAMFKWLEQDLAANKAMWTIVSYHHPTFNVGGHGSTWGRDSALPIMEKHGVDVAIAGHSHLYERYRPVGPQGKKPVIHVVSGAGGAPTYRTAASPILAASDRGLSFCLFTVDGNKLEMVTKSETGKVIDRFTLIKKDGVYQKEIMDAVLTTDEAVSLLKTYKVHFADIARRPEAGKVLPIVISNASLPKGSALEIGPARDCGWSFRKTSVKVGDGPVTVMATPPKSILVSPTPWAAQFAPPLDVRLSFKLRGNAYSTESVPVIISKAVVCKLWPTPKPVDIPRAGSPVQVDGRLGDWKAVQAVPLPSTGGRSRIARIAWRPDGLYGAVSVRDGNIQCNSSKPWTADSLEINIETNNARVYSIGKKRNVLKIFIYPRPGEPGRAGVKVAYQYKRKVGPDVKAAWEMAKGGYTLEFSIRTKALAPARMRAGTLMGFHFVLHGDGDKVLEQFADTTGLTSVWDTPALWGVVRLAD